MRLVEFDAIAGEGRTAKILVNPDRVCIVASTTVPGEMAGPDGKPIGRPATVLDFGVKAIPIRMSQEEVKKKLLEGAD